MRNNSDERCSYKDQKTLILLFLFLFLLLLTPPPPPPLAYLRKVLVSVVKHAVAQHSVNGAFNVGQMIAGWT